MRASPQTYADYLSQRDKSTAWRVRLCILSFRISIVLWMQMKFAIGYRKGRLSHISRACFLPIGGGNRAAASYFGRVLASQPLSRYVRATMAVEAPNYLCLSRSSGYCQGMNFLAGFLLLWLQEEQAFWMLVYLVEDVLLDYFGRSMIGTELHECCQKLPSRS